MAVKAVARVVGDGGGGDGVGGGGDGAGGDGDSCSRRPLLSVKGRERERERNRPNWLEASNLSIPRESTYLSLSAYMNMHMYMTCQ